MLGGRLVVVYDAVVDLSFVLRFFELTVFCRCPLFVFFFTRGGGDTYRQSVTLLRCIGPILCVSCGCALPSSKISGTSNNYY